MLRIKRQTGVALFITLVVLLVVTLISMGALHMSLSQSKISLNNRIDIMTFQAAESGIRAVLKEASSANITASTNVIGRTIELGACTPSTTDPTQCQSKMVYRCVTEADSAVAGSCGANDTLGSSGILQVESRTLHTGQFNVINSSVSGYRDYVFETTSRGCLLESGACSTIHWAENVQELKKMAPADPAANYD